MTPDVVAKPGEHMSGTRTRRARADITLAVAALALLATTAAQAGCKYKRLGAIPATWVGQRLMIDGSVNDAPIKVVVDTGAAWTTVSGALAKRLDLTLVHVDNYETGFGGKSQMSEGRLEELSFGRFQWHKAKVAVAWDASPNLPDVLAGANLLLGNDMELDGKAMTFYSPSDCADAALAYWADDVPWVPTELTTSRDLRANIVVRINDQSVRALVDTGAPNTMLDSRVARRLGFNPDDSKAQVGKGGGIGAHVSALSTATFDTIAIGPEIIRHPRVLVSNLWQGVRDDVHEMTKESYVDSLPEMILGADFVSSHHLLFATSQHRLYFSYLGGEVFRAPTQRVPAPSTAASAVVAPSAQASAAGG
jgi:predicted aspartyl protease